ncbi:MAG: class II aldolase/adducin family protein [Alphaproteobacteria bacterium]|nr:class II aldolase/adducin family protein [Alphaproteobacteria bacterium]
MSRFSNTYFSAKEWQVRYDLAASYHLASLFGWTDLIYTHISARIPEEEGCFLINPFGLHFHEVTPENLVKVTLDGEVIGHSDYGINPAGLTIHSAIHSARPDIGAIVHLHTVTGMAVAALQDGLLPLSQHACHFYGKIAYHDYEGIAVYGDEKKRLAENLGDKDVMILRNHGFLTAGTTIAEAFSAMYTLEKAAHVQITTLSMGRPVTVPPPKVCEQVVHDTGKRGIKEATIEWEALKRLLPHYQESQKAIMTGQNLF